MKEKYYSKLEIIEEIPWHDIVILRLDVDQKELSVRLFETDIIMPPMESEPFFSYVLKLTEDQIQSVLPYCVIADFEPFRGRKMDSWGSGFLGYRDEVWLKFRAVANFDHSMIELPMDYYYDEEHIWPSEKLYRFLQNHLVDEKMRKWIRPYGALSLFFC